MLGGALRQVNGVANVSTTELSNACLRQKREYPRRDPCLRAVRVAGRGMLGYLGLKTRRGASDAIFSISPFHFA